MMNAGVGVILSAVVEAGDYLLRKQELKLRHVLAEESLVPDPEHAKMSPHTRTVRNLHLHHLSFL